MTKNTFSSALSTRCAFAAVLLLGLAGCSSGGDDKKTPPPEVSTFTIGGTVSGLNGTLVLQNNGANNLSLSSNGVFAFTTTVASGAAYSVSVLTQPAGQNCAVTGGSGSASANVTAVAVNCTTNSVPVTIGGTVSGLTEGTLVLQNNLGDNLAVTASTFTFATAVPASSPYFVTIASGPPRFVCTVENASGTATASVTNVQVTCVDHSAVMVTAGGNVSGLAGAPVTLRSRVVHNNVTTNNDLQVSANGAFTFPAMPSGAYFVVTVLTQPAGQTCSVFANGGFPRTNVTGVVVECAAGTTTYTVGGTVTGLTRPGLILTVDANNTELNVPANATAFTFPNGLTTGTEFHVGVGRQPQGATCTIRRSSDFIETANDTDVAVSCVDNATAPLAGTYQVNGKNVFVTFYPNGVYLLASGDSDPECGHGVELGVYNYNANTNAFATVSNTIDTAKCGLWDPGAVTGTVQKTGVGQGASITLTIGGEVVALRPVPSVANTFFGSFRVPASADYLILGNDGRYVLTHTASETAGVEMGCYALTGTTSGTFTPDVTPATCPGFIDTNGDAGFNDADGVAIPYTVGNPYAVRAFDLWLVRVVPN